MCGDVDRRLNNGRRARFPTKLFGAAVSWILRKHSFLKPVHKQSVEHLNELIFLNRAADESQCTTMQIVRRVLHCTA